MALTALTVLQCGRLLAAGVGGTMGRAEIRPVLSTFGFLIGVIVASMLIGQMAALPLMIGAYLLFWARERWTMALAQAVVAWAILYFLFERLIHPIWMQPLL